MEKHGTRIVIVGGVGGGMAAAARARRLDETAHIVVLERGPHVSFASCGLPYHVGDEIVDEATLLVQTPETLAASLNLDVRTGHDVVGLDVARKSVTVATAKGTEAIAFDALILSPGAKAVRPPIPGLAQSKRVRELRTIGDAAAMRQAVNDEAHTAVVIGGGFIGVETAEALAGRGLKVSIVEMAPHVLPPFEREMATLVTEELRRLAIAVHHGVAVQGIEVGADSDTVILEDGTALAADLIVLSAGIRADTGVFEQAGIACERGAIIVDEHGRTNAAGVWAVGDATVSVDAVTGARRPVALAGPASRAGRQVADDILRPGQARAIPAATGTAIVRVGTLTAAMTGANRASLAAAGMAFETLHSHPFQHVGWFPGAATMHLLIHFDPGTGRLLGAQGVGPHGVDKRIDVLATAIRAGLSVADLIDLDLAYAPPFGAAKDPVNLAGMLGENVLSGMVRLWHAGDLDKLAGTALILDVRGPDEFSTGHVAGALNIPHTLLRNRLDEVREAAAGQPVRVMCAAGVRSYIAHRVLVAAGFDSAILSGGTETLRAWLGDRADAVLVTGSDDPANKTGGHHAVA